MSPARQWVMMLSGPSSSGKTTLARAIQQAIAPAVSSLFVADDAFPPTKGEAQDSVEPPILVFHRSLMAWVHAGFNIIVDGSLPYGDPTLRARCLAELPTGSTLLITVTCAPAELQNRSLTRRDTRVPGWAQQQLNDVNTGLVPWLEVDTTRTSPPYCVQHCHPPSSVAVVIQLAFPRERFPAGCSISAR